MAQDERSFWDVRAKEGRDQLFADAALLWDAAREYFAYCSEHPIKPAVAKGAERFTPRVQAMTLQGVCLYLGCTPNWFNKLKEELTYKDDDAITQGEEDILEVMARIEQVIYMYKYNYAVAGLLNARIVLRDLELNEKRDNNGKQVWRVRVEGE